MKVFVVELDERRQPFAVETACECPWDVVVAALIPRLTNAQDLPNRIKTYLGDQELVSAGAVFMRMHFRDYVDLVGDARALQQVREKLRGRDAYVFSYGDGTFQWTEVHGQPVSSFSPDRLQEALRTAEMRYLLEADGVVMPPSDSFHYEGPNGDVYRQFIRFASALRSIGALDAVAFWLAPLTDDQPVVVVDSATVVSIALHLDRYRHDCLGDDRRLAGVECVGDYSEESDGLRARLRAMPLGDEVDRASVPTLVIRSVVSTGKLTTRVTHVCAEAGLRNVQTVAFYGAPDAVGDVFCRMPALKESDGVPTGATIPISGTNYFPELTVEPDLCNVNVKTAELGEDFFNKYRSLDAIAVHRSEPGSSGRHHAVYVDIATLCDDSPVFRRGVVERVAKIRQRIEQAHRDDSDNPERIDVILSPEHAGARVLADIVANELGDTPRVRCDPEMLDRARERDKELLRAARLVLLVDDALITGARLKNYRHFLRACGYHSVETPIDLEFLVGLSRPEDNNDLRHVTDTVHGKVHFSWVEELLLPNWSEEECPWCVEHRSMERYEHLVLGSGSPDRFQNRLAELEDTTHGLRANLFLPWSSTDRELPRRSNEIGPQSIFHADTEAELFAAVASAVQALRQQGRLTKRLRLPIAKVLDPKVWLAGRYYDSALTAAFLRATRRHDVRNAHLRDDLLAYTTQYLTEPHARGIRGEILLAISRGHLPAPTGAVETALEDRTADPSFRLWMELANA